MNTSAKALRAMLLAWVFGALAGPLSAAELSPATAPLYVQTRALPNVMLLFDNSGSMGSTVINRTPKYHAEYSKNTTYPTYEICVAASGSNCSRWATLTAANIDGPTRAGCDSNWKRVRRVPNGSNFCVRMPTTLSQVRRDSAGNVIASHTYEINYVYFLLAKYSGGDLRGWFGWEDSKSRLTIAKEVAVGANGDDGILDMANIRFGLATFNGDTGGRILAPCNDSDATTGGVKHQAFIESKVNALSATGWTPLTESYYEITRYFRGLTPHFVTSTSYDAGAGIVASGKYISPMTNYCQKNYVLVMTDGYPTFDIGVGNELPNNDPFDVATDGKSLPNWDNTKTDDIILNSGNPCEDMRNRVFKPYSDGTMRQNTLAYLCSDASAGNEGSTLYLDDLSLFAYEMDIKPSSEKDSRGYFFSNHDRLSTYTVGFALDNQMLNDAAARGNGRESKAIFTNTGSVIDVNRDPGYFTAETQQELKDSLSAIIKDIQQQTASSAAVATNSSRLDTETTIFQALFVTEKWYGEIKANGVNADGTINSTTKWVTGPSSFASPDARKIFTYNPSSRAGISLTQGDLTTAGLWSALDIGGLGLDRLAWIRGSTSPEESNGGKLRDRPKNASGSTLILGDIVNSDPVFMGPRLYFGWDRIPSTEGMGSDSYRKFVDDNKADSGYPSTVFVGANDGMLHAFNAATGKELFAYMPSEQVSRIVELADPQYKHKYFVDGSPFISHVYLNGSWRTILVGSTGLGGKTVFALDVTDPANFGAEDVLWEFTDEDLGHLMGPPVIVPLKNGQWGVLFGNGVGSATHGSKLYVLNVANGSVIKKFDTKRGDVTLPNGMAEPLAVLSASRQLEYVYAGDLLGNVWKFDFRADAIADWKFAYGSADAPLPFFTATGSDGKFQPITSGIAATKHSKQGIMLTFGTGKYFEVSDGDGKTTDGALTALDKDLQYQTLYGLWDNQTSNNRIANGRADLEERSFDDVTSKSRSIERGSDTVEKGWYLDLDMLTVDDASAGERVVLTPRVRSGRAIFISNVPGTDPCGLGGTSWLMEVMVETGFGPNIPVFDWNGDGVINAADGLASGMLMDQIIQGLTILGAGDQDIKLTTGSSGSVGTIREQADSDELVRTGWRTVE